LEASLDIEELKSVYSSDRWNRAKRRAQRDEKEGL